MTEILNSFSPPALVRAIEGNLLAFHPYFRQWPRSRGETTPKLSWTITDIQFAMFNNILGARLTENEADSAIEAAIARGRVNNVPLLWFTGPSTTPADLGDRLVKHGFVKDEDAPGMAADLSTFPELKLPEGLEIRPVNDAAVLAIWCDTAVKAYGMPPSVVPHFLDWFSTFPLNAQASLRHYVAFYRGQPAATASMLLAAGAAGLYNIATIPDLRGRGIGSAITLAPLRAALSEGFRISVLQSSADGFPVYSRLGFKQYCTIGSYVWAPPSKE
jgi:hypothetical protein